MAVLIYLTILHASCLKGPAGGNDPVFLRVLLNEINAQASREGTCGNHCVRYVFSKLLLKNHQEMPTNNNRACVGWGARIPMLPCKRFFLSMWKRPVNELALTVWFNWHVPLPTVAHKLGFREHFKKKICQSLHF